MATKTLGLELSADVLAVTNAERRLKRAAERLSESQAMLRRLVEDHELAGTRSDPRDIEAHEDRVREDELLISKLDGELDAARKAPELRRQKQARGETLKKQALAVDSEIDAAIGVLETTLAKAQTLADIIVREFSDPACPGFVVLVAPFTRSTVVSRLKFWKQDVSKQRLAAYRAEAAKL